MKFGSLLTLALTSAAIFLAAPTAHAQKLGVDGGLYFPSSSKTKNAFGSSFKSLGPGFGSTQVTRRKLYPDLDLLREDDHGNKATVIFAGAKILMPLGAPVLSSETTGFAPYGGFGINVTYADIDADDFNVNDSGFGIGASAILGASFGPHYFAEARYRLMTSAADFNFSGAQAALGFRF